MKRSFSLCLLLALTGLLLHCTQPAPSYGDRAREVLSDSILLLAQANLDHLPVTVTATRCERSAGGRHDFYSEGDYWWPDSANPEGPYVRRDGLTNPENFTAHREALMRFSEVVGNLTSAYLLTKDTTYAKAALAHCRAWFLHDSSRMNPHLLYAQAIQGRHTGRGIGIIDAIHFMEVVQSLRVLDRHDLVSAADLRGYRQWFADFLSWLTTHPYGLDEKVHPNNHGTCWNMQVGLYARFTENEAVLDSCRENFTQTLLPNQMAADGSFPLELKRTKPYGYALFNLDAMAMNCLILSDGSHDLWRYQTGDGKSMRKGLEYMQPYVVDKDSWPLEPDVMYWEEWPVAHPAFLFGAIAFDEPAYYEAWQPYAHFPSVFEVKRNLPIRNPLIWLAELN